METLANDIASRLKKRKKSEANTKMDEKIFCVLQKSVDTLQTDTCASCEKLIACFELAKQQKEMDIKKHA
jgi:hypothetical protein